MDRETETKMRYECLMASGPLLGLTKLGQVMLLLLLCSSAAAAPQLLLLLCCCFSATTSVCCCCIGTFYQSQVTAVICTQNVLQLKLINGFTLIL